jgi:glycosyltransferase involved in cell wall biosynthesis
VSRPLRVGLNLVFLNEGAGGMGRYASELVPALLQGEENLRLTAFVSRDLPSRLAEAPWSSELDWVRFPVKAVGSPVHLAAELAAIPPLARRRRIDVIHGLANLVPPVAPGLATVATIHDLTWWHHSDAMPRHSRAVQRSLTPLCARRADRVITPSETARDDVVRTLGLEPYRVRAVAHGAPEGRTVEPTPEADLRARLELGSSRVVLSVAQARPYKNLTVLVHALAALDADDVVLVVCGSPSEHSAELQALAERLGVGPRVRLTGWVTDADLEGFYELAGCVAVPSLAEGFGLPVLEAMARGVPVACSNATSLKEVAGDAARLFNPRDRRDVATAIASLLDDRGLADELVRRGHERAAGFSWERAARQTVAIYREALSSREVRRSST